MGYDIMAHFYVNQEQIEEFVTANNLDRRNWKHHGRIVDYYKEKNPEIKEINILYSWSTNREIHEFFDFYGTNFIRNDERLSDEKNIRILIEKHDRLYPDCLRDINWYLHSDKDAVEIEDELTIFFGDDDDLMGFADWLKKTSKNCAFYELSR